MTRRGFQRPSSVRHGARDVTCFWGLAAVLASCEPAPSDSTFPYGSDRTPLGSVVQPLTKPSVAPDLVGVLFADGLSADKMRSLLAPYGLTLVWTRPETERLALFTLGRSATPLQILALADKIEESEAKAVVQAGFVEVLDRGDKKTGREPIFRVITDQVIFELPANFARDPVTVAKGLGLEPLAKNPFVPRQLLVSVRAKSGMNPLAAAAALVERGARFAHPNYILASEERETIFGDALFARQWHHRNNIESYTFDADIDTPRAWDFTEPLWRRPLVAVLESGGFQVDHPDYVDNVAGGAWDFSDCDRGMALPCGDDVPDDGTPWHGTAVAGLLAASADGRRGVVGTCPNCRLLLVRIGSTAWSKALAFDYAREKWADVISNSWGSRVVPTNLVEAIERATSEGRDGLGAVVLFAMPNGVEEICEGTTPDIAALPNVVAVGGSNEADLLHSGGYGDCMELVAPAERIMTTDVVGAGGYNPRLSCWDDVSDLDYSNCFGDNSAATPITAGVAALVLAANPNLTELEVRRLLQDTADKIDAESAHYDSRTGFGRPTEPPGPELPVGSTHGYGRVNAYEAVRVASSGVVLGRNGVDVYMRDNALDWGNTEQPSNVVLGWPRGSIPHWRSVDIKVDAPPYEAFPPTPQTFDDLESENAVGGARNYVYVRVRNRGPRPAANVTVRLYRTFAGTALPALPANFWEVFPEPYSSRTWNSVPMDPVEGPISVDYSGSSVATTAEDGARIVRFAFDAPFITPIFGGPEHHCLLAIAESPEDRLLPATRASFNVDFITPRENNVAQRNIMVTFFGGRLSAKSSFFVNNPNGKATPVMLRANLPKGWQVRLDGFPLDKAVTLAAGAQVLVHVEITRPSSKALGEVTLVQEDTSIKDPSARVMGGLTFETRE